MEPTPQSTPSGTVDPIHCPACGRFAGARARCPHCGTRMPRRMSLRLFRGAAILLATVGLGLLYAMVRAREIPLVRVDDVAETMNFAYVRVAGQVHRNARVFRSGGRIEGLRFTLDDGTGAIDIRVRGRQAEVLEREGRIPRAGDRVELAGSLQVTADAVSMWLQDAGALHIDRETPAPPPPADPSDVSDVSDPSDAPDRPVPLATLADIDTGTVVEIEAEVVHVRAPPAGSNAPWRVVLQDGSGAAVPLVFWDELAQRLADRMPAPGQRLRLRARRDEYRGTIQLRLLRADDLRPAGGAPAP